MSRPARIVIDERAGVFRDEAGRERIFRGLNAGGRSKWSPYLPFEVEAGATLAAVREVAEAFFAPWRRWGMNLVRLPVTWAAVEPARGCFDEVYLSRLGALVDAAWSCGLYVVLDAHQDVFAGALGGDGFPRWALPARFADAGRWPERRDNRMWFLGYLVDPDVREAFERLWSNEDGVLDGLAGMWRELGRRLGDHPGVLGAELLNEPAAGHLRHHDTFKREVLRPAFERLADAAREAAPDWLIFYGAPGVEALGWVSGEDGRPRRPQVAHAPHLYDPACLGLPAAPMAISPERALEEFARFRDESGTPIVLGEFGITHGARDGARWLTRVMDAVDAHRLSATIWECSWSAERWNGEDLCVVDPRGRPRDALRVYVRPWCRALAGEGLSWRWDHEEERLVASWTAREGVSEIVIPTFGWPQGPRVVRCSANASWRTCDGEPGVYEIHASAGRVELHVSM